MQKVGFILFMLGAGGMDSPDVSVPAVMVFSGLGILAVSAWRERRKGQYGKTGTNSRRYRRNVPDIEKYGLQNNKTA